ncbi:MAG: tRNA pseudouridine(55) synthase TruB [Lachnospiraceae bacterium]|nr:tRNA pseudouridine(55) synthase TruB [Lachnospiraceae bacterium]
MGGVNAWNGLLCVNKEAGFTSNDVVAKLRGILKQKKIGHTGTLDPEAVGVLVVCLGNATRVVDLLTEHSKEYIAVVQLGVVTDTQDMTGEILEKRDTSGVTRERLTEALQAFKGSYEQVPPMYSAVKVNGQRLYKLAREGKTVERKPRTVTIDAISLLDDSLLSESGIFTMEVRCSKGTYIRTLCNDIGERLDCGAAMAMLTRTAVGSFRLESALTLTQIEEQRDAGTLADAILPVEELFRDMDRITVSEDFRRRLENGNSLGPEMIVSEAPADENDSVPPEESFTDNEAVRVYCGGEWFGIYRYSAKLKQFRVDKFFRET